MSVYTTGLRQLAQAAGIQTAYLDVLGHRHQASPEALLAALNALGIPLSTPEQAPASLITLQHQRLAQRVEPTVVVRPGRHTTVPISLPLRNEPERFTAVLLTEDGQIIEWSGACAALPRQGQKEVGTTSFTLARLTLPSLSVGYHTLQIHFSDGVDTTTHLLCAPLRAWLPDESTRWWGIFVPLYALTTQQSWGAGNFSDLLALALWIANHGGQLLGTLPLLDTFLSVPFEPSPYAPVSRLFWNPFYLDLAHVPELEHCPEARDVITSAAFRDALAYHRASPLVDYQQGMQLRTRILDLLTHCLYRHQGQRYEAFRGWLAEHPEVEDYARFRALLEQTGQVWQQWPQPQRDGHIEHDAISATVFHRTCYAQWLATQQLTHVAQTARHQNVALYLDLPIGVHPSGYDTWRWRKSFALDVSAGAPPDAFYPEGQIWNFPPLHPISTRQDGHAYFRAIVRHHLSVGQLLRLDHVMGLHRLYWIPHGASGHEGVYVRYPAEELYAVLAIESQRAQAVLIGEDLGTVPQVVRAAMRRHHLLGMYILPFEQRGTGFATPSSMALAALNTHDLLPFAALWNSWEPQQQQAVLHWLKQQGWLDHGERSPGELCQQALAGVLAFLAASPARILLVNAEDLWLETEPQNRPGTGHEQPNWRHKARLSLEEWERNASLLDSIRQLRKSSSSAERQKRKEL